MCEYILIIYIYENMYYGSEHGQASRSSGTSCAGGQRPSEILEMVCYTLAESRHQRLEKAGAHSDGLNDSEGRDANHPQNCICTE